MSPIVLFTLLATLLVCAAQTVEFGTINPVNQGKWVQGSAADPSTVLSLGFIVKDINLDKLQAYLAEVSNPNSPNFGKYLDAAQISALTSNPAGQAIVSTFLTNGGATIESTGQKITASATVSVWQGLLSASFYVYSDPDDATLGTLIRTPAFSLPTLVAAQLSLVTNTVDFPVPVSHGPGILNPPQ